MGSNKIYKEYTMDTLSDIDRVHNDQSYFYVDSALSGVAAWSGKRLSQGLPTLASAYDKCTASRGDVIYVSPFHTETVTTALSLSKIGVQIIGKKLGNQRPVITINGAVDMFSFAAAAQKISGLECTIVTTDAATAIVNFAAAKCVVEDLKIIPSATSVNVVDVFTLASGGTDAVIKNTEIWNTVVAVNSFLSIEAAVARLKLIGNRWFGDCATAGIIDAATGTFIHMEDNVIATIGSTIPAVTLDNNPAPLIAIENHFLGTHTTIATNADLGNLARKSGNMVLEATDGSVSATPIIPAYDTE